MELCLQLSLTAAPYVDRRKLIIALSVLDKVCMRLVFSRDRPTLVSNVELSLPSTEASYDPKDRKLELMSITARNGAILHCKPIRNGYDT